jgi:murein DD-endopeptidase MepM/ murein hydrolase activator NlpD
MRSLILFTAAAICSCAAIAHSQVPAAKPVPFPLQLEMRVPFEPTAFPSGRNIYAMYELHLTNFGTAPLTLSRIEVVDADAAAAQPIATFNEEQLETMTQSVGGNTVAGPKGNLTIAGGRSAIVFMSIAFDGTSQIPNRLLHHVITTDSVAEGAVISTHYTTLHVLGPPLQGANWVADDGPSNDQDNHHRRGIFVLHGRAVISRRYAIDWEQIRDGATFSGDSGNVRSYFAYGKPVLAVANGRVVVARDGLPDNVPGHGESFHPAVPITLETVGGNMITLDLGGGQFAYYMHLQTGSLRVKVGDRVRRGQLLARIGSTGDAREPHLHFEVTTAAKIGSGEGVPYLIDRYRFKSAGGGPPDLRLRELPLDHSVVDFGDVYGK